MPVRFRMVSKELTVSSVIMTGRGRAEDFVRRFKEQLQR
jgi:hypothetical protein